MSILYSVSPAIRRVSRITPVFLFRRHCNLSFQTQASKQADVEERLQKAKNAAAAAQEKSREAARQAAESREKVHRLESAQDSFLRERNHLQKHVGASIQAIQSSNVGPFRGIDRTSHMCGRRLWPIQHALGVYAGLYLDRGTGLGCKAQDELHDDSTSTHHTCVCCASRLTQPGARRQLHRQSWAKQRRAQLARLRS